MAKSRARKHPDLILLQLFDSEGSGFTYLSAEDFDYAADHFMLPGVRYAEADVSDPEQRRELAYDFLWRYFQKPNAKGYFRENVRWIATAATREKFAQEAAAGRMPRVVVIARKSGETGGIVIRDAQEYLEHPGWPLALIIGKPQNGGGAAQFFATREAYEKAGASKPTQEIWLPQIVYRLYAETPSVVMGLPKPGPKGEMGVECMALGFGERASLVERQIN